MRPPTSRGTPRAVRAFLPALPPAILAVAAGIFWFSHVPGEREAALARWKADLGVRADFRRDALDAFLRDGLADATLLANFPAVRTVAGSPAADASRGEDSHARAHFDEVVTEFRRAYAYDLVAVFDETGRPAGGIPAPSSDGGCLAAARGVLGTGEPAASMHVHERGEPALTLAAPIREPGGRLLGAVLIVTGPGARLYPLLGEAVSPRTGEVLLLARDGDDALYLSPLRHRPAAPLALRRPLDTEGFAGREALEKPESAGVFVDYRGERVLAATRRLAAAPWGLVVKLDESEALEPFWAHVRGAALGWGGALLAVLGLAWGIGQRLRRLRADADTRSEARFRTLFEQANDAVLVIGEDGRVTDANRAAEESYGMGRAELVGRHVADFRPPEQRKTALAHFATAGRVDRLTFEGEHLRADGSRFPVEVSTRHAELPGGLVHISIVRDISRRKSDDARVRHLNRLLHTIIEINQLIARTDERNTLLGGACQILVERGGFALVWVGLADRATGRVVPVARAGQDEGYVDEIEVRCDDSPLGRGPVGTAIRTGRSTTVTDVPADPRVEPWRARQLARGFRVVAAFPLRGGDSVHGALTVYSTAADALGEEETSLLDGLATDLASALDRIEERSERAKVEMELRTSEEALRANEARLRSLFDGMLEGYAHCEMIFEQGRAVDWIFLDVNPAFERLTGLEGVVGRRVTEVLPGLRKTNPEQFEIYGRVASTGQAESFEGRVPELERWYTVSAYSPRKGEFVTVFQDVTARKEAEESLARSELTFRSIIEKSLDVTFVVAPDSRFLFVSPATERVLGYRPEELNGSPGLEFVHPEDRPFVETTFRRVLEDGARVEQAEFRFRHRDGSWRTLSAMARLLAPEAGMQGVIVNLRDISDRLHLEAQVNQTQKMEAVGRLAGGVAHDFNNLLTVISGYAELLSASLANDPEHRESLDEIVKAAERAATLTRQLLAFSRQQVLELRVLDVAAVVGDTEKMLRRLIGEDIEVDVVKPASLGRVRADPGQVEQILLNLAVNSRDSMPGGGRLTIRLADVSLDAPLPAVPEEIPAGRYVVISMTDTGTGMDAETMRHIFEPFFTTKRKGKGTGLGLATVYGIVRQSGGYAAVESAPGAGTTLRIYLPRCEETTVSGIRAAVRSRRGSETVLLVEDEPAVRALAKAVLEGQGYTVIAVEHGDAALDVAARDPRPIHVLLTDLVMPGMNGRELASRLKASQPSLRVLFMSGYAADVVTDLAADGTFGFLPKPFNERTLTLKIREVLDAPA